MRRMTIIAALAITLFGAVAISIPIMLFGASSALIAQVSAAKRSTLGRKGGVFDVV